ncbi:DGQHR domain-containing protein [Mesorhizobium japonicum]|uniref:DGQHR domain-containing protein n=1 Tax=Mesorhizobium japonicum TaxID=2066070 RepID=UPI003B5A071C
MGNKKTLPAIKVNQWLSEWDEVDFDENAQQKKPSPHFFLCAIKAKELKSLTGVYRRSVKDGTPRLSDPNVQRGHEESRSKLIGEFVKFGYPWCEMTDARRSTNSAKNLQKPGWLPSAIIVNILPKNASRNGVQISERDIVTIDDHETLSQFNYPADFSNGKWKPESIYPLEVIDGQHRLWAFENFDPGDNFELPVIAFYDLDRSWQAYLFWSVNITPKKINKSLAFDLYPLLRKEDWLDQFAGHSIYRETRCQELVEALWSSHRSPWRSKINMLGEKQSERENKTRMVSQAAWIKSLLSTFVKEWTGSDLKIGGLFGASKNGNELFLPWNRPMQAALLITIGNHLQESIKNTDQHWAKSLRLGMQDDFLLEDDPAMFGEYSLLSTDQGIRGVLHVYNDLLFVSAEELELEKWTAEDIFQDRLNNSATDIDAQDKAIDSLADSDIEKFIESVAVCLANYDWRTSATPGIDEAERKSKLIFRGSSGYKEIRKELISHLNTCQGSVGIAAKKISDRAK